MILRASRKNNNQAIFLGYSLLGITLDAQVISCTFLKARQIKVYPFVVSKVSSALVARRYHETVAFTPHFFKWGVNICFKPL